MSTRLEYALGQELIPEPTADVRAVVARDADTVVTAGNDTNAIIWKRTADGTLAPMSTCVEAMKGLRALCVLDEGSAFVEGGGFACGGLDGAIRVYDWDGSLVGTLEGHEAGVVSLCVTPWGDLVSGGWDGTARVWQSVGASGLVLDGHENAVCVCCLSTGVLVAGSTGRRDADGKHVDYQIRLWSLPAPDTFHAAGQRTVAAGEKPVLLRKLKSHEGAVRAVAPVPGLGFASVSNDGSARLWTANGAPLATWRCVWEGHSGGDSGAREPLLYSLAAWQSPDRQQTLLFAGGEDYTVRVIDIDQGPLQTIKCPGVPWSIFPSQPLTTTTTSSSSTSSSTSSAPLPDLWLGTDQGGTSTRGHIFRFSTHRATQCTDEALLAKYAEDCAPPKKRSKKDGGSSAEAAQSQLRVLGSYEDRLGVRGEKDGANGIFRLPDGNLFVCAWNDAEGSWVDIGQITDSPDEAAGVAGLEGDGTWDCVRDVELPLPDGGVTMLKLKFNRDEEAYAVTQRFLSENALGIEYFEQVRDFVIQCMDQAGGGSQGGAAAGGGGGGGSGGGGGLGDDAGELEVQRFIQFPSAKLDKAMAKVEEVLGGDGDIAGWGLGEAGLVSLRQAVTLLGPGAKLHDPAFPASLSDLVVGKLLRVPVGHVVAMPVLDIFRRAALHIGVALRGAERAEHVVTSIAAHIRAEDAAVGTMVMGLRALSNFLSHEESREAATTTPLALLMIECATHCLQHSATPVQVAAASLLANLAFAARRQKAMDSPLPGDVVGAIASAAAKSLSGFVADGKDPRPATLCINAIATSHATNSKPCVEAAASIVQSLLTSASPDIKPTLNTLAKLLH